MDEEKNRTIYIMTTLLVLLWAAIGIAAFIMSLLCFGRSGTMAHQIVGLLLAIFVGPFYWIYYFAVGSYCRKGKKKFLAR